MKKLFVALLGLAAVFAAFFSIKKRKTRDRVGL
jgi:hypothetical protein